MTRSTIGLMLVLTLECLDALLGAAGSPAKQGPTIGMLLPWSPPAAADWKPRSFFLQELRTLGWREGENLIVDYRWAAGRLDCAADLTAELVRLHVDVLFAVSTSLIGAAQHATTTIPIVMSTVDDPVAEGFITSLPRPGGNITGVDSSLVPEMSGKLLELLNAAVPAPTRIAVLVHPAVAFTGPI